MTRPEEENITAGDCDASCYGEKLLFTNEWLIIVLENEFLSTENIHNLEVSKKASTENKANLASAYADLEIDEYVQKLVDAVYERSNTDMGEFWMSFMKISDILLQNVDACHVGKLDGYLSPSHVMLPEMLAYDNHDYNKWLLDSWVMIGFLPHEKKKYFSKHFAQSVTSSPWSDQSMDLLIKFTMNLDSKLKQGWVQLLQNNTHLLCTTRNVNNIIRIKAILKSNLNCNRCLRSMRNAIKDEQAVQYLIFCMDDFDTDPFDESAPDLRFPQSGVNTSLEILENLWYALEERERKSNDILERCVFFKE